MTTITYCPSCHVVKVAPGHLCPACARQAQQAISAARLAPGWLARLVWWQAKEIAKAAAAWGRDAARLIISEALYFKLMGLAVILLTLAYLWLQVRQ